ncbi:ribosomal lysine N-methyltransferase set11 [Chaetomidium leptoderma]|uniref:Ribosomal lysine N-methyltransferase set11 n=1 Tax=Chaetomidium leptoderma TaxID=669021 RepID=A0AAN6ZVL2_9PEZI|nr:ribosomal lysine N-methyltransferase set11 [Chaetomidium leptoderma]
MEVYDELLRWAQDRGVELHGVAPRSIPGRGIGMVATKPLKANERILLVPTSALRTIDTVRPKLKAALPKGTKVHATLAADLALDKPTSKYWPWNAVVPSRESITASLPLAWPAAGDHSRLPPPPPLLTKYLPKPALALLHKQQSNFTRDWTAIQQASSLPTITRQEYLHFWLLTNTRTFYHETRRTAATLARDDRMVLQPVADLFNHADAGCEVAFGAASFTVTADRAYAEGEEVYICYGQHANDFLLVEYGFVLPPAQNRWDEVCLDDAVLPELSERFRGVLEAKGFLGGYVLDARTVCYRTQVALRLLAGVPVGEWERLVEEGEDGGKVLQGKVDGLLVRILNKYRGTVEGTIRELEGLEVGQPYQREVLCTRWQQIRTLIDQTIERLGP